MIADRSRHRDQKLIAVCTIAMVLFAAAFLSPLYASSAVHALTAPLNGKNAGTIIQHRRVNVSLEHAAALLQIPAVDPSNKQTVKPFFSLTGLSTRQEIGQPLQTQFPLHNGTNAVTSNAQPAVITKPGDIFMLPDQRYFDTLIDFMKLAALRIDMAMFLFKISAAADNRPAMVLQELIAAGKRGVQVNMLLEKSGYDNKINTINSQVVDTLKANGINVRFDSKKRTSHMKLVVIDQRFCFIGSHNLTHAALTFNHEITILVDSVKLAKELTAYIAAIE